MSNTPEEFDVSDGTSRPASRTGSKILPITAGLAVMAGLAVGLLLFTGSEPDVPALGDETTSDQAVEEDEGIEASGVETEIGGTASDNECSLVGECDEVVGVDCSLDTGCDDDTLSDAEIDEVLAGIAPDPFRDLFRAFDDLDEIDPDRSVDGVSGQDFMDATDGLALKVVSSPADSATTIAITFNGAAQEAVTEQSGTLMSRSFGADVLITPLDGRILNVLFHSDGKIKISDIPSGMSITSKWVTPDELLILIAGLLLTPGAQVEAIVLMGAYGGFMSDAVRLALSSA
jgi:hypothetical protein